MKFKADALKNLYLCSCKERVRSMYVLATTYFYVAPGLSLRPVEVSALTSALFTPLTGKKAARTMGSEPELCGTKAEIRAHEFSKF